MIQVLDSLTYTHKEIKALLPTHMICTPYLILEYTSQLMTNILLDVSNIKWTQTVNVHPFVTYIPCTKQTIQIIYPPPASPFTSSFQLSPLAVIVAWHTFKFVCNVEFNWSKVGAFTRGCYCNINMAIGKGIKASLFCHPCINKARSNSSNTGITSYILRALSLLYGLVL